MNASSLGEIGSRFKIMRESLDLNQAQIGSVVGLQQGAISKIERGLQAPSESILKILEYSYGIYRCWLLTGEGEMVKERTKTLPDGSGFVEEENVNISVAHSDNSYSEGRDYSLIAKGTGMMTIGDVVQYVHDYGNAEEKEEMMFKKLEFIDTAKAIALKIRNRRSLQKKAR